MTSEESPGLLVIAGASVCVLFYLLTVKTHNHSLFRVLYDVVPGAKAIRVGYRGMVVANLFAVTAIGLTFDRVVRLSLREPRTSLRLGRLGALTAVLALAAIEQVESRPDDYLIPQFRARAFGGRCQGPARMPELLRRAAGGSRTF